MADGGENTIDIEQLEYRQGTIGMVIDFEILSVSRYRNQYDWPMEVILRKLKEKGRTWRGQQQWHFLVRFTGSKEEIKPQEEELKQVKWVKKEDLPNHFVFEGQWDFIHKVLQELLP